MSKNKPIRFRSPSGVGRGSCYYINLHVSPSDRHLVSRASTLTDTQWQKCEQSTRTVRSLAAQTSTGHCSESQPQRGPESSGLALFSAGIPQKQSAKTCMCARVTSSRSAFATLDSIKQGLLQSCSWTRGRYQQNDEAKMQMRNMWVF